MATSLDPVLSELLSRSAGALQTAGTVPGRIELTPGRDVAWDNCCEGGGQLYVRMTDVYPAGPFPDLDRAQKCGVSMTGVFLAVGILRCAHVVDDRGNAPSANEVTSDALQVIEDSAVLYQVLQGLGDVPGVSRYQIGRWTPLGPSGGCTGGEWALSLGVLGFCYLPESA